MSVVSVTEKEELGTSHKETGGVRTHTRVFWVELDGLAYTPYLALVASGIPTIGLNHPWDVAAKVKSIDAAFTEKNNPHHYTVTVNYSTNTTDIVEQENPLDRPAKIIWGGDLITEQVFFDFAGKKVANSATEPYENAPERETYTLTLTVIRNEAAYNAAAFAALNNAVNATAFTIDNVIVPELWAKTSVITAVEKTENDVTYFEITYPIKINFDNWRVKLVDQGLNEYDSSTEKLKAILDKSELPIKSPHALKDGSKYTPTVNQPEYDILEFQYYQEINFAVFNFP